MSIILRLAATLELTLYLIKVAFHPTWLPLFSDDAIQIAVVLGGAVALQEWAGHIGDIVKTMRAWVRGLRRDRRSHGDQQPPVLTSVIPYIGPERRGLTDRRSPATGGRRSTDLLRAA